MTASEIIKALGGSAEVAEFLGVELNVVSNMRMRGIPRSRLLDIYGLAVKKNVPELTIDVVNAAAAPTGKAA